jgi:hypothetical protein
MARTTALDLITAALEDLAVLADGDVPTAGQGSHALDALNALIDQWAAEKLTVPAVTLTTATLTANQASFTVGAGGNINIARPVYLEQVNFIDTATTPDTEFTLPPLLTEQAWAGIVQKALTSTLPQLAYYSPTYPLGTLYPWPIPTQANLLWAIYHWAALAELAAITTVFSLPPAYERMIVKNLAVELAPSYSLDANPVLIRQAGHSMDVVKRANFRMTDMSFPSEALIGHGGGWDIRTGP